MIRILAHHRARNLIQICLVTCRTTSSLRWCRRERWSRAPVCTPRRDRPRSPHGIGTRHGCLLLRIAEAFEAKGRFTSTPNRVFQRSPPGIGTRHCINVYYFTIFRRRNPRLVEKSRFGNGFKLQFRRIFVPLVSISRKSFQTFEKLTALNS